MATKTTKKVASKKKGMSALEAAEIGAGVLATIAAAGAAGYYFYGTKNASKHRHAASVWAKGLKRDAMKQMKKLEKVDAKTVAAAIEQAASAYRGMKGVADTDVELAVRELKKNWTMLQKEMEPSAAVKKAVKTATHPKVAKKEVKKVVKKAVTAVKKATKKSR
ncbi:MAG: hypothetical protein KA104_01255 [Candidatus Pacebacteria bacterium]|nr:hypothetical protein [Candidatus Paceibacterota bacterium]